MGAFFINSSEIEYGGWIEHPLFNLSGRGVKPCPPYSLLVKSVQIGVAVFIEMTQNEVLWLKMIEKCWQTG